MEENREGTDGGIVDAEGAPDDSSDPADSEDKQPMECVQETSGHKSPKKIYP